MIFQPLIFVFQLCTSYDCSNWIESACNDCAKGGNTGGEETVLREGMGRGKDKGITGLGVAVRLESHTVGVEGSGCNILWLMQVVVGARWAWCFCG